MLLSRLLHGQHVELKSGAFRDRVGLRAGALGSVRLLTTRAQRRDWNASSTFVIFLARGNMETRDTGRSGNRTHTRARPSTKHSIAQLSFLCCHRLVQCHARPVRPRTSATKRGAISGVFQPRFGGMIGGCRVPHLKHMTRFGSPEARVARG